MRVLIFIVLISFNPFALPAQNIAPAPPDKAVVYFIGTDRFYANGLTIVFNGEEPLGLVGGFTYMRYECEPGAHIFWVRLRIPYKSYPSANQFLEAELLAGRIYVMEVRNQTFGLRLNPVIPLYEINKSLDRVKKTLNRKGSTKLNLKDEENGYYKHKIDISRASEGMTVYPGYSKDKKIRKMQSNWFFDPEDLSIHQQKKGIKENS